MFWLTTSIPLEISIQHRVRLGNLLSDYVDFGMQVCSNEKLTPKAHFLTHYGRLIRENGPLSLYWCTRFEGKHRLAKLALFHVSNTLIV